MRVLFRDGENLDKDMKLRGDESHFKKTDGGLTHDAQLFRPAYPKTFYLILVVLSTEKHFYSQNEKYFIYDLDMDNQFFNK